MTGGKNKEDPSYLPKSWGSPSRRGKRSESSETATEEPAVELESERLEIALDSSKHAGTNTQSDPEQGPVPYPCRGRQTDPDISCSGCHRPEIPAADWNPVDGPAESKQGSTPSGTVSQKVNVRVAGIRFSTAGKIYHFESGDMGLDAGDWVIVKTDKGVSLGLVAVPPFDKELDDSQREGLRKIIRKAGKVDFDQQNRCNKREAEAFAYCMERIEALDLPMKLVAVECFFDGSKYVFFFTAEGRVDFRELVKQLVARFPVRIEMRQIGVRHEAKMTGGIATCGQELCCARFLSDFRPVSVKMAKNQNLSLNPAKISGVCGRLMCCLAYEHGIYEEFRKGLPKVGKAVRTTKGDGVVVKYNPLKETVCIRIGEDTLLEVTREEILKDISPWIEEDAEQHDASEELDAAVAQGEEVMDDGPGHGPV